MKYTNLFEKIINIFKITQNSWFNFIFLGFLLFISILVYKKKMKKNIGFLLSCVGCFLLMGYVMVTESTTLGKILDDIMNHLFIDLYFPSVYVYLFVLLFMNIVTIGSLLNIRKKGIYKVINGICFLITNFILVLILELLSKNNIDIFSKKSLFSNTDLVILLEFSISIFLIWLLVLMVIYLTDKISERILLGNGNRIQIKNPFSRHTPQVALEVSGEENTELEPASNKDSVFGNQPVASYIEEENQTEPKFIPTFINQDTKSFNKQMLIEQAYLQQNSNKDILIEEEVEPLDTNYLEQELQSFAQEQPEEKNTFDLSSLIPKKQENTIITPTNTQHVFEQILNNTLPIIEKTTPSIEEEKNTYTLNDYRIFNKMLKDIKEHNQNNTISIDKNLEYRLITKYSSETYDLFKRMLKNYSN